MECSSFTITWLVQIFMQFIVYGCFGKRCRQDNRKLRRRGLKVEEDEEDPLIRPTDEESSLPCFSSHGNIQKQEDREVEDEWRVSNSNGYGSFNNKNH